MSPSVTDTESYALLLVNKGSGRPSKITDYVYQLVEQRMCEDDETTAMQLHELLVHIYIQFLYMQCFVAGSGLGGHLGDQPTVS